MATAPDPFEQYLNRAASLFDLGDVVQAGQIWQAILKRNPDHKIARAGLYKVKVYFDARATQDGLIPLPVPAGPESEPDRVSTAKRMTLAAMDAQARAEAAAEEAATAQAAAIPPPAEPAPASDAQPEVPSQPEPLPASPAEPVAASPAQAAPVAEPVAASPAQPVPAPEPVAASPAQPVPAPEPVAAGSAQPAAAHQVEANVAPPALERVEDPERMLRDGCTLYEMGELADALKKWERILASDPGHVLARAYANDARKDLGLPLLEDGSPVPVPVSVPEPAPPPPAPAPSSDEQTTARVEVLVREGVQLYDMGMLEEAVGKWKRALEMAPGNSNATDYIAMAERDQQQAAAAAALKPVPRPNPPGARPGPVLLKVQREGGSPTPPMHSMVTPVVIQQNPHPPLPASMLPKAITDEASQGRYGLKIPPIVIKLTPEWLKTPRNAAIAAAVGLVAIIILSILGQHYRETALKAAVLSAKADALKPVARQVDVAALGETPDAIRQEAEAALGEDPLLAYFRAKECLHLDSGDAKAMLILDKAKAGIAAHPLAGSREDLEKNLKNGELEEAGVNVRGLLCLTPDDPELMAKARIIALALAQFYATKERFGDARDCLCLVRAMYPQENIWQAKLKLLEAIQGLSKAERANWIPMLG